jgi:hypothetical protein
METNKKPKFTPGPWQTDTLGIGETDDGCRYRHIETQESIVPYEDRSGFFRMHIALVDAPKNCDESLANAQLIAAAPEMYEALDQIKSMARSSDSMQSPDDLRILMADIEDLVVAALKKARGEK